MWFRGIFLLNPQPGLIAAAPFVYQLHAALAWFLFALWPFSRLVHVWSYPIQFLARPNILISSLLHASGAGGIAPPIFGHLISALAGIDYPLWQPRSDGG